MQRWYCVHTRPRAEAQAREHLQRQGFEVFLPRLRRSVLRGGRRQAVTGVSSSGSVRPRKRPVCSGTGSGQRGTS